jgi:putative molybdopterin biosynthesis protein
VNSKKRIQLQYRIGDDVQRGAELHNDLFDLLAAVHEHGSIVHASAALDRSYRFTWGQLKRWEELLGQPLIEWVQGQRARLTPYALRLVWAERQARVRMTPHLEALRAQLAHVFAQAEQPGLEVIDVWASHDLGLPRLQAMAADAQLHLNLQFVGSEDALRALQDGRCHVAGFHVPRLHQGSDVFARALRSLLEPGRHKLIGSHRRVQGLMMRKPGLGEGAGIEMLAQGALRFVNRQPGSGTRLLMDHLVQAAGIAPERIDGYLNRVEHTHVAVAAAIASGAADAGLGIEAAAREFGLHFTPVIEEDYYLVCLKPALESNAVRRLRTLLQGADWERALSSLAGYALQRPGQVLSMKQALPWWRFDTPKRAAADTPPNRTPSR